jgi:Tfp pilus assembly protein PilV
MKLPKTDDRGETLIETLISIVLLGILGLALLDGMVVLSKSAALYSRQASAFKNQRNWAEDISKNTAGYTACPGSLTTTFSPSGDTGTMTACSSPASGILKMTITVTSTEGNRTFTASELDVLVMT